MRTGVILAAGQGTRLRGIVEDYPKGFLKLGQQPIIAESIGRLIDAGIDDIIIVTGYQAGYYKSLARQYIGIVSTVHNARFADSGSMYSLYCARNHIQPPFLLLESDLVYESRALDVLMDHPSQDAILISGPSHAGDEVYVETKDERLLGMSKDAAQLGDGVAGELVGISKISGTLFELMVKISEPIFEQSLQFDYETDCLVAAGRRIPIACPLVEDLLWAEIDDASHLARAKSTVYPAIRAIESR